MGALKAFGGLCVFFAAVLVIITLFFAIGFFLRFIAVIAAIIGILMIMGVLVWLAVEEIFGSKKKPR